MTKFRAGDRVGLVVETYAGYEYINRIGHMATVMADYRGGLYLQIKWDKPSERTDGGFHVAAFELAGGPW